VQFAPYVNVNAIAPGFIATESELNGTDDDFLKMESEKVLLKRAGTEEDVARLVEFLVSDNASYINNEVIRIDGGLYGNL
jgi:3-oxoacyl-[acyl-carrier protein] reductase